MQLQATHIGLTKKDAMVICKALRANGIVSFVYPSATVKGKRDVMQKVSK